MRTLLKMLPLSLLVSTLAVAQNSSYFQPNSTGVKLQNGFERVFVQVCPRFISFSPCVLLTQSPADVILVLIVAFWKPRFPRSREPHA